MNYLIRKVKYRDAKAVVDIYNYFIKNSFAAYSDMEMSRDYFKRTIYSTKGYPFYIIEVDKKVVGYGLARPYYYQDTFKRTAVLTYFILPDFTDKGLGTQLFEALIDDLKIMKVDNILVNISSRNEQSLHFHNKMGFVECGKFNKVGRKQNKDFDLIWMQKFI